MISTDFLIIAGAQKAGTTSLFNYFKNHPQINPCAVKEPCYFLPTDYPVPSRVRQGRDSLESYLAMYDPTLSGRTRMEATATYLHIPGAARQINRSLPAVRIVLGLREPIARLVSWYKMCAMLGMLDKSQGFEGFAQSLLEDGSPVEQRPHHRRALQHGIYAPHVAEYLEEFSPDRIRIFMFDDLSRDPLPPVQDICAFAGLDAAWFDNYKFKVHFQSRAVRSRLLVDGYEGLKRAVRASGGNLLGLRPVLRKLRKRFEPGYYQLVTQPAKPVRPDDATLAMLREYYRADTHALQKLLQRTLPWTPIIDGTAPWASTAGE